jgi:cellulose synthase/poly-beta-1,6-N-acetylglucosamine synthase-like glycosyltransferase
MFDILRTRPDDTTLAAPSRLSPQPPHSRPWWLASMAASGVLLAIAGVILALPALAAGTPAWWLATLVTHVPLFAILLFLLAGAVERVGYLWRGRIPRTPGTLPLDVPTVCVQLPLYNEHAVGARIIAAAGALRWPDDRLELQVLDDSTDPAARWAVDEAVRALRSRRAIRVAVRRRAVRDGYKAGALEAGRHDTAAEFIAIFDADFMPTPDFLQRTMPHFYDAGGRPDAGLALVQAQWGHLNPAQSALTRAQSLWVDDHHTVQMSWRSAQWGFVNFTGTAGVWRADAVERVGGWRATSLVEDCEISFRQLFAGFRTTFVRDVIAPAELPATYASYKAQQRRWTQGWVQVQHLHLGTLARRFDTSPIRRVHLLYHMCIPWQWPLWAVWVTILPALIHSGLWFGALGFWTGIALYFMPMIVWMLLATVIASAETPHLGARGERVLLQRVLRLGPYIAINTGMLPHQFSAFLEGLFGPMSAEFVRTPKAGTVATGPHLRMARRSGARIQWPYAIAEAGMILYQASWAIVFLSTQQVWPAVGALFLASCIATVAVRR